MTIAPPPPQAGCLPCQLDPEEWFDADNHVAALADCLSCPARRWCAAEALECRAAWGLWAGVWIGGRHDRVRRYLEEIAGGAADEPSDVPLVAVKEPDTAVTAVLDRPLGSASRSVSTAILARSCGHCEVMAEGCSYTYDQTVSRHPMLRATEISTPPSLFAACDSCADMVAALDAKLASEFGYIVDDRRDATQIPFFWRQCRWVLLDRDGWVTELTDAAQTA